LSETRTYRKFTAQHKTEIVLASLRGPKSVAELCREHDISDSLLRKWRDQFLAAGAERLQGKSERTEVDELRGQVAKLKRALGRKTMEVEVAGELVLKLRCVWREEFRPSSRPAQRSAPTSIATTTDLTAASPTGPRARSPRPAKITTTT
jgi:transposase